MAQIVKRNFGEKKQRNVWPWKGLFICGNQRTKERYTVQINNPIPERDLLALVGRETGQIRKGVPGQSGEGKEGNHNIRLLDREFFNRQSLFEKRKETKTPTWACGRGAGFRVRIAKKVNWVGG